MSKAIATYLVPNPYDKKGKFAYDAEVFPNFLSFIFKNIKTGEIHKFIVFADRQDDRRSINQIGELIDFVRNRVEWLIGYNSVAYDNVLVMHLTINQKRIRAMTAQGITTEMVELSGRIISAQNMRKTAAEVYLIRKHEQSFKSLDLILLYNTVERTSLKQLAVGLKWSHLEDLPFPFNHIVLYQEIPRIEYYNLNDVNLTEKLMYHLSEKINYRIAFTKKFGVNILNSCNSDIAKQLISFYYTQETGIDYKDYRDRRTSYDKLYLVDCVSKKISFETPYYQRLLQKVKDHIIDPNRKEKEGKKTKKQFEVIVRSKYLTHTMGLGGVHSNGPAEILQEDDRYCYLDVDVEGFYPRIIVNDNLYPRHLGPRFVPIYKRYVVDERVLIKKTDPILSYMLKIAANATFGLTKSEYSWLYDPRMTTYICVSGQLYLFMLMEAIERYSKAVIVYSNTDGLTIRVPREELGLVKGICNKWEQKLGFKLEYVYYKRMIMRDVNNFIMFSKNLDPEKEIKAKGIYVYKKEEFKGYNYPIIAKAIQDYFEKSIPVEDTIFKCQDVYEYMASQKTSIGKFKVTLFPRHNNDMPAILQKTNRWIVTDGNNEEGRLFKISLHTDERTAIEKSNYVTILNDVSDKPIEEYRIDYNFYVSKAMSLINLTRQLNRDTHLKPDYVQTKLFA